MYKAKYNPMRQKSPDAEKEKHYILIPVYSEQSDEDGNFDIINYRKEYI